MFRLPLEYYDKLNRFENKSIWLRRIVIKALDEEEETL